MPGGVLAPAPDRYLPGGLVVKAAFLHTGPARALVHRLKYEGIRPAAELLATALVERWGPPPDPWCRYRGRPPSGGSGWTCAGVGPSDGGDRGGCAYRVEGSAGIAASWEKRLRPAAASVLNEAFPLPVCWSTTWSPPVRPVPPRRRSVPAPALLWWQRRRQPRPACGLERSAQRTRLGAETGGPEVGHETPWGGRWWR